MTSREWNVTVGGRIEQVTDLDSFPEMLREALDAESHISIVQFDAPTWPHTTRVVFRISAPRKKDAERIARDIMLPVLKGIVDSTIGVQPFGWTLNIDAVPLP